MKQKSSIPDSVFRDAIILAADDELIDRVPATSWKGILPLAAAVAFVVAFVVSLPFLVGSHGGGSGRNVTALGAESTPSASGSPSDRLTLAQFRDKSGLTVIPLDSSEPIDLQRALALANAHYSLGLFTEKTDHAPGSGLTDAPQTTSRPVWLVVSDELTADSGNGRGMSSAAPTRLVNSSIVTVVDAETGETLQTLYL